MVAGILKKKNIVIFESTVYPGTLKKMYSFIGEDFRFKIKYRFFVGYLLKGLILEIKFILSKILQKLLRI